MRYRVAWCITTESCGVAQVVQTNYPYWRGTVEWSDSPDLAERLGAVPSTTATDVPPSLRGLMCS